MASDSESRELVASSRIRIRRLGQECAGDGEALPLASGELDAAFADDGVVGVREALGELVDAGRAGSKEKLLLGGIGLGDRMFVLPTGWALKETERPVGSRSNCLITTARFRAAGQRLLEGPAGRRAAGATQRSYGHGPCCVGSGSCGRSGALGQGDSEQGSGLLPLVADR